MPLENKCAFSRQKSLKRDERDENATARSNVPIVSRFRFQAERVVGRRGYRRSQRAARRWERRSEDGAVDLGAVDLEDVFLARLALVVVEERHEGRGRLRAGGSDLSLPLPPLASQVERGKPTTLNLHPNACAQGCRAGGNLHTL